MSLDVFYEYASIAAVSVLALLVFALVVMYFFEPPFVNQKSIEERQEPVLGILDDPDALKAFSDIIENDRKRVDPIPSYSGTSENSENLSSDG